MSAVTFVREGMGEIAIPEGDNPLDHLAAEFLEKGALEVLRFPDYLLIKWPDGKWSQATVKLIGHSTMQ